MSEHSTSKTPSIKSSSQDQFGKKPLQSWSGKVVSFDSQKDQIEGGWGWRYKVRILGDNSNVDNVKDEELSYAFALLPTTAGSGGGYKLRSARVSQGDMVYGIRGGGGPTLILGVFPRTRSTTLSNDPFGTMSGFYGTLVNNGVISGEFNEQVGPATPGGVSGANKSNRPNPKDNVEKLGIDPNKEGVESGTDEKTTPMKKIIDAQKGVLGMSLNKETFSKLEEAVEKLEIDPVLFSGAIRQAVTQGLLDGDTALAKQKLNEVRVQMYSLKEVVDGDFIPPGFEDAIRTDEIETDEGTFTEGGTYIPPGFEDATTIDGDSPT